MAPEPSLLKRELRSKLRERRRSMPVEEREAAASGLTRHLVDATQRMKARSVSAYLSRRDEPSTRGFLSWAAASGVRVLLPVSGADGELDWAAFDGTEQPDALGMPAPTTTPLGARAVDEVDLMIVPAAAVDRSGQRLGWGRGSFDRVFGAMQRRPPVYAVVFDGELVDTVPTEAHDRPVDGVITPTAIITF